MCSSLAIPRRLEGVANCEMLEYDVTLTGVVANRQIITLEEESKDHYGNPFELLIGLGKRSISAIASLAGAKRSDGGSGGS